MDLTLQFIFLSFSVWSNKNYSDFVTTFTNLFPGEKNACYKEIYIKNNSNSKNVNVINKKNY